MEVELPVVVLVRDAHGAVERAAERLRQTGLRNPMVHLRHLDDLGAWQAEHAGGIAFLILHAEVCQPLDEGSMPPDLPSYPAFAVETVDGRLMASILPSPGALATPRAPFDAPGMVRSLHRLGLRWLVV